MTARPRLVIALVVASLLSVFLVYTALAGSGTLLVSVDQLAANKDGARAKTVQLTGTAIRCDGGDCAGRDAPFSFTLKDDGSPRTMIVSYASGSVPDAFKEGRHVIVTGRVRGGVFVAQPDSLVTKCPSKYSAGGSGA
jgi:cytochrome c-type biogenesis protein CcmE